ncbi:hypothetical protein [Actinokineospora globicatena]|uniref:hypothetical protein n=1 Tax=Actinokineospora globicatena TaxID=103729 RepID=UPI00255434E5|nr:hypothetical protein [Actinokineospora globicatena]
MPPGRVSPPRAPRAVRGVLLAGSSTALAISAHGMAGGGVPDTAVTLALTALVAWAGTALADRRGGLLATLALLGISQVCLHVLLTDIAVPHDGHVHAPVVPTGLMLATHVVATLVNGVLLTVAGAALNAIASAVTGIVRALVISLAPSTPLPSAPVAATVGHLLAVVLRVVCGRRGPPVLS